MQFLRHEGKPKPGNGGIQNLENAVEDKLALNAHLQLAPALLEPP